ncbi:histidine kinase [Phenylobacterium sp.]|jgi:two-component system sensor histidine kinase UhpB|uniref:histidine kinase n=1 Tax=Phenylobacterium sp. TaxID=1871053 RepID=UPI002F40D467
MAPLPDFIGKTSRSVRGTLPGQVMAAAFAALAASLAVGALALVWDARRSVDAELASAMASAAQAARTGLQDAQASSAPDAVLSRAVRMFDGNRHVRAVWLDGSGAARLASRPDRPSDPPPAWFVRLIDPRAPTRLVGPVRLEPNPVNEISEVWAGLRDALLIVGLLSVLAMVLIRRTVRRALAPLEAVSGVLARVGAGDFEARAPVAGVAEVERLATGVNAMAGQLDAIDRENRRLHEQLATVQEEERAEIARDLHDEIGPYLFAVNIDAAAVRDLAAQPAKARAAIPARVALIEAAVAHMQTQVSDMLRRLRPLRAVEFGLSSAVEDLVAFWRARRPDIAFELSLDLDDAALGLGLREAFYRIAQEALSNAVRHGAPSRIALQVSVGADQVAVLRVADNGAAVARTGQRPRFGLIGMRERLAALGGELVVDPGAGQGWTVTARAPLKGLEVAA